MITWSNIMRNLRINPASVARQLLANLKTHKPLSQEEERKVISAIERHSGVSVDRVLASLSRNTIEAMLKEI